MDIQGIVDFINLKAKLDAAKKYSLGELIKDLESNDKDLEIIIDDGSYPLITETKYALKDDWKEYYYDYDKTTQSIFDSWRGSYDSLAIKYSSNNQSLKVKDLLEMAKFIEDKYLEGYKGGDFLMDKETPIYIDNYGEYRDIQLIGTKIQDNKITLITKKND